MNFPNRIFKIQLLIMALACNFLPCTVHAQQRYSAHKTDNYFLDNFKCSVDMSGSLSILGIIDNGYYFPLNVGLGFGYYFLKYKYKQLGVVKKGTIFDYKTVTVDAGDALISIETGIRCPEKHVFKYDKVTAFQIEEKFLVIPLTIQHAAPDFFSNGTYSTLFLGYNFKYLLSSKYTVKEDAGLHASFCKNIPDLKKHFNKQNTSYHSITLGYGLLFPFGMYLDMALDFPLTLASTSLDVTTPEDTVFNEKYINKLRSRYINVAFRLGVDILMMVKKYKGVSRTHPSA